MRLLFFPDSSFCTVSLLQVSNMLHPIFVTLPHSDRWVLCWDMTAISSCVTSELPRALDHDEEEVEGTAPASFFLGWNPTVSEL